MNWFLDPIVKKYADFGGRASRKEYWMFHLVYILILCVCMLVAMIAPFIMFVVMIGALAIILPALALTVRRLHDIGKSGWWVLISFIPYVGGIVLLVLTCLRSEAGSNKYGENPYGVQDVSPAPETPTVQTTEIQ